MTPPRSIKDGLPWCWQSKDARRRIREAFDATHNVATALSVYDALTEIASDEGTDTFKTTHAWIQRISGVGVSTIKKHLAAFAEEGLISVSTPTLRAPSTYTLLTLANHCPTLANSELALAISPFCAALATSEENKKKPKQTDEQITLGVAGESVRPVRALPKPAKPRERNLVLDALVSVDGSNLEEVTKPAWRAAAKALEDIREVNAGVTVQEIERRASNYRLHMPNVGISPLAIAKHWARCDRPPNGASKAATSSLRHAAGFE